MNLKSRKKFTTNSGITLTRVKSPEDTLSQILRVCENIGVTRISDITCMDRLYIPNYSAILPGTEDTIWVYGGKGPTRIHAKVSALMEAIERYSSLSGTYSGTYIRGSYSHLAKSYKKVLHPAEVVEPTSFSYNDKAIADFLPGFDLITKQKVLVPAQLALSRYSAKSPATDIFQYSHTNGLASGNVLEEAICHALFEVIERDAVSIADLCASSIPYSILERITKSLKKIENCEYSITQNFGSKFVDDPNIYPVIDISQIADEFGPIKFLAKRFTDARISLMVKDITQEDIGIPTFVASSIEWITSNYGYFARGYGTHIDRRIALIRAITELSQTRAVNIQGARDDLKKIQYNKNDEIYKRKWEFMPNSSSLANGIDNNKTFTCSKIKTCQNKDILDDLKFILNRLMKAGLKRAIIVDLTNSDVGIPVVRAIVPGLETFEVAKLFQNSELTIGSRAKTHLLKILHS